MYSTFDVNPHCIVNGSVTAEVEALHDLTVKRFNFEVTTLEPLALFCDDCWQLGRVNAGKTESVGVVMDSLVSASPTVEAVGS